MPKPTSKKKVKFYKLNFVLFRMKIRSHNSAFNLMDFSAEIRGFNIPLLVCELAKIKIEQKSEFT